MPILTDIEEAMKLAILGMTTGDGYNYNWHTVNEDDLALCTFPCAEIGITEERNVDDPEGAWFQSYNNEVEFEIVVHGKLDSEEKNPNYAMRKVLNKALDDLKQLFGINYHITNTCDRIMYAGMTREIKMSGDVHVPGLMSTTWNVRYTQDRLSPETPTS